jgi:hypothetical protein
MSLAVNYDPTIVQSATWPDTTVSELGVPQVEIKPAHAISRQEAIQVTVSDVGGSTFVSGEGATFAALSFDFLQVGPRWNRVSIMGRA